jgi:hypothetical protein
MTNNNYNEKRIIEEKLLDMIKQLRGMNLLLKEDVSKNDLIFKSLSSSTSTSTSTTSRFSSDRFRYLVSWYPNGLKKKLEVGGDEDEDDIEEDDDDDDDDGDNGNVLLHYSTMITDFQHSSSSSKSKSKSRSTQDQNTNNSNTRNKILQERIRPFQLALEAGITHFPNEIGFLFHKNNNGITPYDLACNQYGENITLNIVRQICFVKPNNPITATIDNDDDASHAGLDSLLGGFMKTEKTVALKSFLLAAIDSDIKLDSIYVQLRQDPNMIQKLILLVEKDNDDSSEGVEYWDYYNDNNNDEDSGDDRNDSNTECDFVIPVLPVLPSLVRLFTIVVDEWKRVTRT